MMWEVNGQKRHAYILRKIHSPRCGAAARFVIMQRHVFHFQVCLNMGSITRVELGIFFSGLFSHGPESFDFSDNSLEATISLLFFCSKLRRLCASCSILTNHRIYVRNGNPWNLVECFLWWMFSIIKAGICGVGSSWKWFLWHNCGALVDEISIMVQRQEVRDVSLSFLRSPYWLLR